MLAILAPAELWISKDSVYVSVQTTFEDSSG